MKTFKVLTLLTILALSSVSVVLNQKVNYSSEVLGGWACSNGKRQSPITLVNALAHYTDSISLLNDSYLPITNGIMFFNTKTKLIEFDSLTNALAGTEGNHGSITIDYNGYLMKFDLRKIIFHIPPEHSINGKYADFEIQLIHTKDLDYTNPVNQYKKKPDISTTLKISVPYKVGGTSTDGQFFTNIRNFYSTTVNQDTTSLPSINISDYPLTKNKSFYFYTGSDTSSPCNENTLHFIISDYNNISQADVDSLKINIFEPIYLQGKNTKNLSEPNGRFVFRNFFLNQTEASNIETPMFDAQKTARETLGTDLWDAKKKLDKANSGTTTTTITPSDTTDLQKNEAAQKQAQGA
jgi:carbonic anhydrase